jgi:hypothetical protein
MDHGKTGFIEFERLVQAATPPTYSRLNRLIMLALLKSSTLLTLMNLPTLLILLDSKQRRF